VIALAVGVGGFLASAIPGHALAAATPAALFPEAPVTAALTASPVATADDRALGAALSVVPVQEQAFEATRVEATASPEPRPAEDVVRAARTAPAAGTTPALEPGDRVGASLSFYYCEAGETILSRGDGGGFCGAMRDGSVVYNGAAACDVAYLGQRFRIQGDPLGRIYRCADTGSAVHGLHRDIWFNSSDDGWAWQLKVGQAATIEIVP